MKIDLYRDRRGRPRARGEGPGGDLLARFLEADVQGSVVVADEVLDMLDRVESGETERWEDTGNVHTLVLTADGAQIRDELKDGDEVLHLPLAELREALNAWLGLLLDGES